MRGARLGEVSREMARLHALPDRFLGRALLDLARNAVRADPRLKGDPRERGYESLLIRSVLPRLAQDLGETRLTAQERAGARATPACPAELRSLTGTCLNNAAFSRFVQSPDPQLRALSLGFANGSPITIGLDRACPPTPQSDDLIVRHMREISRVRFGDERFSAWAPAMQVYPGRGRGAFKRPPEPEPNDADDLGQDESPSL